VRKASVWAKLLGCENTVVEDVGWEEGGGAGPRLVAHVRPARRAAARCGVCGVRCPGYDRGAGRRRWRALDLGTVRAYLEADAPRVACPVHGVVVAAVPWARHGAGHTRLFDDQTAWLAAACSKAAVTALMRISWRTVGHIIARVTTETGAARDRLAGLRRIGIDEISYRKGHKYLVIVVDHDSGLLVWAAPGRDAKTVAAFFAALGPARTQALTHVSADGADWIARAVADAAPQAIVCADPFHVVSWAATTLDEVRRDVWRTARSREGTRTVQAGNRTARASTGAAQDLKRARYALWKNPENLTTRQAAKLAWIEKTHPYLHRAYLLKEGLRTVFQLRGDEAKHALARWLGWAARCRIPQFTALGRKIRAQHLPTIHATLDHHLSNGLIESVNTKIRLITRMAYGFHSPAPLIAMAMLTLGGLRPALPRR
jgi:transposase